MPEEEAEKIVDSYRSALPQYESFAIKLESLIIDLLKGAEIRQHFSESRAKTPESLAEKLVRPGKSYESGYKEVPDLVGVRMVLYYEDDVPKAGDIIREEFEIIEEEGAHQPEGYSPDQFGYLSFHFVVSLNAVRRELPEWKVYEGMRAEIQVRTVLQHSWAAVSHALQYKREGDVPKDLRRKLFRLAGLFELADEEFVGIRDKAAVLDEKSREAIKGDRSRILVDSLALKNFLLQSEAVVAMQKDLNGLGYIFDSDMDFIGRLVEESERLGINTIDEIETLVSNYRKEYFEAIIGATTKGKWRINRAFAFLLILIDAHSELFTIEYLVECGWAQSIAERVASHTKNPQCG